MLHEFVALHREEIVRRCRAKVAQRSVPPPTTTEIDHGVPLFLGQLADALRLGRGSTAAIGRTALLHGHDLRIQGLTVSQVVHDYGDVCQSITELAAETNAPISADDFQTLNACLDDAIAVAVTQYAREGRETAIQGEAVRGSERLGFLAHELRNLINTGMMAFDVLKSGNVGVGGSTGTVLYRSLVGAGELISRSLAEVRLTQGLQNPEPVLVSAFIDELIDGAALSARAARITLKVSRPEAGVVIEADRQVLTAVMVNLLQNAFKFTQPETTVTLRVRTTEARVLLEVEDECGGLPAGDTDSLFRPFEQRSADRSGLGIGLAFSRWGVEANHGRIYARSLPGVGCVFTIDLPRIPASVLAAH